MNQERKDLIAREVLKLSESFDIINSEWPSDMESKFSKIMEIGYPFGRCFSELNILVKEWSKNISKSIQKEEEKEKESYFTPIRQYHIINDIKEKMKDLYDTEIKNIDDIIIKNNKMIIVVEDETLTPPYSIEFDLNSDVITISKDFPKHILTDDSYYLKQE